MLSAVLLKNPNFQRPWGTSRWPWQIQKKIRWCTGTSSQLFRTQGFRNAV